ncbi:putative helicase [Corchorus olitorius]|uniref:Helicase n=1 Tax=Corchorus olitorius TaxID=93759 RepID=A0A1R3JNW6_9ROSI|nr:putative helicase [Corchorus olitorius]
MAKEHLQDPLEYHYHHGAIMMEHPSAMSNAQGEVVKGDVDMLEEARPLMSLPTPDLMER